MATESMWLFFLGVSSNIVFTFKALISHSIMQSIPLLQTSVIIRTKIELLLNWNAIEESLLPRVPEIPFCPVVGSYHDGNFTFYLNSGLFRWAILFAWLYPLFSQCWCISFVCIANNRGNLGWVRRHLWQIWKET